jgi:RING finger protein 113A
LLSAGTKRTSSQRRAEDPDADDNSDDRREGPGINWASTGGHVNKALEILAGDEAEEMLAKRVRKVDSDEDDVPDDGLYHGQKSYKTHIKKSQEVPKSMRTGPVRSNNSTIRTVTIVDYQPDVCKDYKETGFCGFGDTCKFLHDRGTYLAGWQLDKLAANPQKQAEDPSGSDSDDDLPFACLIGRHPFTDPVVTRCGHYFCSSCAIKRFAKTPKCAVCGAPTGGIFNRADKVMAKMKKLEAEGGGGDGDGDANPSRDVQIEGLNQTDPEPEHSDSDPED